MGHPTVGAESDCAFGVASEDVLSGGHAIGPLLARLRKRLRVGSAPRPKGGQSGSRYLDKLNRAFDETPKRDVGFFRQYWSLRVFEQYFHIRASRVSR